MLFVRDESHRWRPYPDLLRSPVEEADPFFRRMQQVAVWPPVTSGSRPLVSSSGRQETIHPLLFRRPHIILRHPPTRVLAPLLEEDAADAVVAS